MDIQSGEEGRVTINGAPRTGPGRPMWCEHRRRGRVNFPVGLPQVAHAVAVIEVFEPVVLDGEDDFPLDFNGTPISYFSLNDFLNVTLELRTLPEIIEYLDRRRALPLSDLRTIGEERPLFAFYLLNEASLAGCVGIADAKIAAAAESRRFRDMLVRKRESDRFSGLLEYVADQLATRLPNYADGLSPQAIAEFDPPINRQNYLEMQRVLAELRLRERAEMGRAFDRVIKKVEADGQGFAYRAMYLESVPEWVYVFGSGLHETTVRHNAQLLMTLRLEGFTPKSWVRFGSICCQISCNIGVRRTEQS